MNNQQASQPQEAEVSLTSDNGNGSHPPSDPIGIPLPDLKLPSTPKLAKVERIDQASIHKSTGPRTPQGKQRSKFNALKHGLYSKAVLLEDESPSEYDALLIGMMESLQPEGKLETVLVEYLTTLSWRKRRLLQVETAEISKADFLQVDSIMAQRAQVLDSARQQGASDGMRDNGNDLSVVRQAINSLDQVRLGLEDCGTENDKWDGVKVL